MEARVGEDRWTDLVRRPSGKDVRQVWRSNRVVGPERDEVNNLGKGGGLLLIVRHGSGARKRG